MSNSRWYANIDGEEVGPITVQDLLRMVREGAVRRDTLVRTDPEGDWVLASSIEGLFSSPLPAAVTRSPRPDTRIAVIDGRERFSRRWLRIALLFGLAVVCALVAVVWMAAVKRIQQEQKKDKEVRALIAAKSAGDENSGPKEAAPDPRKETMVLVGHTDIVKAVAFSPDGRYLLSGGGSISFQRNRAKSLDDDWQELGPTAKDDASGNSEEIEDHTGDRSVRVWEVASGRQLQVLEGHSAMISAVAFSPDRRYAISVDTGGTAILWDAHDWQKIHTFRGKTRERSGLGETRTLNAVAFAPDSRRAVLAGWGYDEGRSSANYDKNPHLILWDLETGEEVTRTDDEGNRRSYFDGPPFVDELHSAAYTADGAWIVAGASGSNAGMYYYGENGKVYRAIDTSAPPPVALTHDVRNPDEYAYEVEDCTFGPGGHDSPTASFVTAALSSDGNRVVSADTVGRFCLWNFAPDRAKPESGGKRVAQIHVLDRAIRCLAFSPTGQYIISGGDDLLLWHDVRNRLEVAWELGPRATGAFRAKPFHIHSLALSPDGKFIAAGCDDHRIRLWKVP